MPLEKKLRTEPKQSRAEVTAETIIQAAIHALESTEEIESVTSQNLAAKSWTAIDPKRTLAEHA